MQLVGKWSLHDARSQAWLLDRSIRDERMQDALYYADLLLRTRPDVIGQLGSELAAIASDPKGRDALVAKLKAEPPWRAGLLDELPKAAVPTVSYAVLVALNEGGSVQDSELRPFLNHLVEIGDYELGYLAWREFRPGAGGGGLLSNGDFTTLPTNIPFDWIVLPVHGADTQVIETGDKARGQALQVSFADTRVPYASTRKLLLLRPGNYTLSGLERASDLVTVRGLVWRLRCAVSQQSVIGETRRFAETTPWHSFEFSFTVPSADCRAQWLQLETAARIPAEQQIDGVIWFDHLAITPAAPTTATN